MSIMKSVNDFLTRLSSKLKGGGDKAIEKQKKKGKNTARERVEDLLLDEDSFLEIDLFVEHSVKDFGMDRKELAGDGVITGYGKVHGRPVAVFAQDFTVAGGSLGRAHSKKIVKVMDGAAEAGIPLVGINDSGGARIQEGVESLCGYGEIFYRNTKLSGVVPQISVILGPCAGGAVYSPALTDFVFVVDRISNMFITGPQVIKTVLGEDITQEELGGAFTHASITGNAHFYAKSETEAFNTLKKLLSFLPANSNENPPVRSAIPPDKPLGDDVIPDNRRQAYCVKDIIRGIVDASDFLEVHEHFAANMVVGFARLAGQPIGIIANQPRVLAGVLDVNASDKAARFIRFCDCFNIPLLTLVDTPGYLPGADQEHAGVIRHGAKILYAYSEASVPKLTLIMRKAYGGAYIAMCSRHLGATFVASWPCGEIAVMGPEGAANIIFRREIAAAENPEEYRQEMIRQYEEKFANPYVAANKGYIDTIIRASMTRETLIKVLSRTGQSRKGRPHGNIPL